MKQAGIIFLICLTLLLSACGKNAGESETQSNESEVSGAAIEEQPEEITGSEDENSEGDSEIVAEEQITDESSAENENCTYVISVNGYTLGIYDAMDDVVAELGQPSGDCGETASCAYQGSDYYYYYDSLSLEITANEFDGIKRVTSIKVIDDMLTIPQGIRIGSSLADVENALGTDYTENGSVYTYREGSTALRILIKNDAVAQIEYNYKPE